MGTKALDAATRIKAAEQSLQKRTSGGFLTTGVGRDDINPRDVVTSGAMLRGGGGMRSRSMPAPRPAVSSPVAPSRNMGVRPFSGTPIRRRI